MNVCEEYAVDLLLYLDNELSGQKLEQLLAHLKFCAQCRDWIEEQRELSVILDQSRPLYSASPNLRTRVGAILAHSDSGLQVVRPNESSLQRLGNALLGAAHVILQWKILAPAIPLIALCLFLASSAVRQVRAAEYAETALSTHRSYLAGGLPLEFQSTSPQAVAEWVARRVPFAFRLPTSQTESLDAPSYRLVGARLIAYKGDLSALITYEGKKNDAISLLVVASKHAVAAGGVEVSSGDLVFHYRRDSGFQVITWSTHGLTYALVSTASGSAGSSCLVCHQNMRDRKAFLPTH